MLGCNSNIQIGSPRCMLYDVHYSKCDDFERAGNKVIRRIKKQTESILTQKNEHVYSDNIEDDYFQRRSD